MVWPLSSVRDGTFLGKSQKRLKAICYIQKCVFWLALYKEGDLEKDILEIHTSLCLKQDFVMALSILLRGTAHEKLRWTFNLYDINKDGYINKEVRLFPTNEGDCWRGTTAFCCREQLILPAASLNANQTGFEHISIMFKLSAQWSYNAWFCRHAFLYYSGFNGLL